MTAEHWDNSPDQAPPPPPPTLATKQQQHDTRNSGDCRCWTSGSFLYNWENWVSIPTIQHRAMVVQHIPPQCCHSILIISPQSLKEGREGGEVRSSYLQRAGRRLVYRQTDRATIIHNTIRMSQTWLDINSRKHSCPVNTLIADWWSWGYISHIVETQYKY